MFIDTLGTYPESTPTYTSPEKELGRDQFLTLLVAQLKNQDPLNPLESADFTAQLAQFSSLEQLFGMNESLKGIEEALAAQESGNVLDYIGKSVKTLDNSIFVKDGTTESNVYELEDGAEVTISIRDEEGLEIRTIYAGWQGAGEHELIWDGKDNQGSTVDDGIYTFELEAMDEEGFIVPYDTYLLGVVTGVTYYGGDPFLMVGNKLLAPENIIEVRINGS
ncbi:MAG: flagellar hook assembly protein FlgD [Deltaproteobacteria bacterium]|nr:MAG: flagellar hook assembly protein FlgD [Deltaproteobacteria bacterium]